MVAGVGISPIQVVYAVTVCNSVALASVLWRHREQPGAIPLFAHVLAAGAWAGSLLGLSAVEGLPALALLGVLFLAVGFSVMTLVVFTLEYTGRERLLTRSTLLALLVEPVLAALLAVVNPAGVFIRSYGPPVEWGIAFWLHTAYSYLLLVLVSALILGLLYRSRSLYRGQSAALLGAVLASWIANVVSLFGPVEADISPIGFLVAGGLFAVAIVRYRLTDIAPIARDRVLENVSDGIFVVDREDRLIDANPVGRDLLTDLESAPIGATIESLLADRPEVREAYRRLTATPTESERDLSFAGGHYHVRTTPIEDDRDRHVGWLFIVRDITDRKHRETQLERQNDRLERFADIVSHDLRNPLTVADGHLDFARETGDLDHLDEVERSHERMGAIIDDVLALAREGESVTDPVPVAIAPLAEDAWAGVDTGDAALSIEDPQRFSPTTVGSAGCSRTCSGTLSNTAR